VVRKLIGPVFQAVQDGQAVLVTLEARPQAAAFHAQIEVRDGSQTAKLLKDAKSSAFADLGKMPAGRTVYTGFHVSPKTFETLAPLMLGASSEGEGAKAVKAALDEMVQAKPGDRADAMSVPPAGLSVWNYGDPAKAVEAQLKLLQAMGTGGSLQSGVLK